MGSRNKFWSAPCLDGFPESNLISLGVSAQGPGADESDDAVNSSCLLYCGRAWRKWKWRASKWNDSEVKCTQCGFCGWPVCLRQQQNPLRNWPDSSASVTEPEKQKRKKFACPEGRVGIQR
ncbi:hypothetical protein Q8A67_024503 [Cirrhinus molitorella]|uniref:Uncharacterized protein n=1 Tax=Cirrhinus molitorella TaxID=172907 RepID=A0AA88NYL7_9TELE|nr:hypothetical protein Q8A67_024503 [Cirrhinus molitorella]